MMMMMMMMIKVKVTKKNKEINGTIVLSVRKL